MMRAVLVVALLALACGGSDSTPSPAPTPTPEAPSDAPRAADVSGRWVGSLTWHETYVSEALQLDLAQAQGGSVTGSCLREGVTTRCSVSGLVRLNAAHLLITIEPEGAGHTYCPLDVAASVDGARLTGRLTAMSPCGGYWAQLSLTRLNP